MVGRSARVLLTYPDNVSLLTAAPVLQVELYGLLPLLHDDISHLVWRVGGAPLGLHAGHKGRGGCRVQLPLVAMIRVVYHTLPFLML